MSGSGYRTSGMIHLYSLSASHAAFAKGEGHHSTKVPSKQRAQFD